MTNRFGLIAILICVFPGFPSNSRAAEFVDGFELLLSPEPASLAGMTAQHNSVHSGIVTVPTLSPLTC